MADEEPEPRTTASHVRGEFLAAMVRIERRLNFILRDYLAVAGERHEFFADHFLDQVGFRRKVRALRQLIDDEDAESYRWVLKELDELYQVRNSMAHDDVTERRGVFMTLDKGTGEATVVGEFTGPAEYFIGRGKNRKCVKFDDSLWDRLNKVGHALWDLADERRRADEENV